MAPVPVVGVLTAHGEEGLSAFVSGDTGHVEREAEGVDLLLRWCEKWLCGSVKMEKLKWPPPPPQYNPHNSLNILINPQKYQSFWDHREALNLTAPQRHGRLTWL